MRILIALAALLMLTGCQPPTYQLTVKRAGERLVIEGHGDESWPFGWKDDTINAGMVSIYDREGHGWTIYMSEAPGCNSTAPSPTAPFPLTYGTVPRCYSEKAPADPIRPGVAYKIEAGAAMRQGMGAFRLTPSGEVVALTATAMGVDGEEWPPETNPGYIGPDTLNGAATENSIGQQQAGNAQ